jgi:hypothetical protein
MDDISHVLAVAGTIPGLSIAALSCLVMAMKVYSQHIATRAHAEHAERILRATTPEQLALLEKVPPPAGLTAGKFLSWVLLLSVAANGASVAANGYQARKFAAYNKCAECSADQPCVNGKCQATTIKPAVWSMRHLPKSYDYALGSDDAR